MPLSTATVALYNTVYELNHKAVQKVKVTHLEKHYFELVKCFFTSSNSESISIDLFTCKKLFSCHK